MSKRINSQLRSIPDIPILHQLLAQALEKKGQKIQASWRSSVNILFVLEICAPLKEGSTQWQLFCERSGRKKLLFTSASHDILFVYKQITTAFGNETTAQPEASPPQPKPAASTSRSLPAADSTMASSVLPPATAMKAPTPATKQPAVAPKAQPSSTLASIKSQDKPSGANPPTMAKTTSSLQANSIPNKGNLETLGIDSLLKTISALQYTGKLSITQKEECGEIFFKEGNAIEARLEALEGDDAVASLLTWSKGEFSFEKQKHYRERNVDAANLTLLEQSRRIAPAYQALRKLGFKHSSTFFPTNPQIGKEEFLSAVSDNCPLNLGFMVKLYRSLNGEQNLGELIKYHEISLELILTGLNHLIERNVVAIRTLKHSKLKLEAKPIDGAAIESVMMSLRRQESGLFIYPAWLYFLEEEFYRSYRARATLSIILFSLREAVTTQDDDETKLKPLSNETILDATARINNSKRHMDLLGHYNAFDYALILPNTKSSGVHIFANRLIKKLTEKPLVGMGNRNLAVAFGSATIPDDCKDLGHLIGAAELALQFSIDNHLHLTLFQDISHLLQKPQ
jgi:hypothetical protein